MITTPAPPLDDPALAPFVRIPFDLYRRSTLSMAWAVGLMLAMGLLLSMMERDGTVAFVAAGAVGAVVLWYAYRLLFLMEPARRLLAAQPWRQARATVDTSKTITVVEESGATHHLALMITVEPVLECIASTETVWLVGPDDRGRAAVRIPGGYNAIPATVRSDAATQVRLPAQPEIDFARPASEDQVAASYAMIARSRMRRGLLLAPAVVLVLLLGFVLLLDRGPTVTIGGAVGAVILATVMFAGTWRSFNGFLRLPDLLAEGPWLQYPIEIDPWDPKGKLMATGTGRISLPDHTILEISLPNTNTDVVGYAQETGTLWFAGAPSPGGTYAVGVPGHVVLGIAVVR